MTEPLKEAPEFNKLMEVLSQPGGSALAQGCLSSQKLHLIDAVSRELTVGGRLSAAGVRYRAADAGPLRKGVRCSLIITFSEQRARQLREEYAFYDRNVVLFPPKDLIFYQADLRSNEIERERLSCLRRLLEGRPTTAVTTFSALMTPIVPLSVLRESVLVLEKHGVIERAALAARLVQMGYEKTAQVQEPGQFAVRGDIVDIYDLTEDNPVRVELWDDEIDSIRTFDPESQRSLEQQETVRIYPAAEFILTKERLSDGLVRIRRESEATVKTLRSQQKMEAAHRLEEEIRSMQEEAQEFHVYDRLEGYIHYFYPETSTFLDLFPKEQSCLFLDEPVHIQEEADAVEKEFRESSISRSEKGYILPGQMQLILSAEQAAAQMDGYRRLGLAGMDRVNRILTGPGAEGAQADCSVTFQVKTAASYNRSFDALTEDLKRYRKEGYRVLLISASRTRARRLAVDLTQEGVTAFYGENPDRVLEPGEVMTWYGSIAQGFEYPALHFLVVAETDIFGAQQKRKKRTHRYGGGEALGSFSELRPGDYVVHEDQGIGIYRGVEKIEVEGTQKDYLKIEYGGGGTLYILPTELSALQKYAAQGTTKPKLSRLGSQEWSGTKAKVRGAVDAVAQDLVELYAKRQALKGHAFGKDTVWQQEFEELFPYEETQDQLRAIEDTKRDMESDRIMDRLICGDVGFGKTEIAIRAAFKAVQDGMQTAVLVPTTILAQQHFNTFTDRMKDYPVCVEMLSRFQTAAEIRHTLEGLASGRVDIVIGTHRLLSKDVKFRRLGLLVVDEEQRFGVSHKEKIKKLRENVDVLTLTATPIPRTLHMSLIGIRDMSLLEEAPQDRTSVQTYVMEYDEEMVREAVLRELSRGGQVYYVHNRVNDIMDVTGRLQQQIPEARIAYAHGQMNEAGLERIMYDFVAGEIDVLVSTTIIETGLDIPNVNTIIIHDSERMGLSQLYQLRGRVGRSNRTAYAFLMYRKDRMLQETAEKRLMAIREFTELGSGYRIAMRDLEIRGAGNLLGKAQSGHMASVGYDLYCRMLDEAVKKAKGTQIQEERTTSVNLPADAYIPDSYILNESLKLDIYKKIASVSSLDDCEEIRDELRDRFGEKIPAAAENLLRIALIRAIAGKLDIEDMTASGGVLRVTMRKDAAIRVENIPRLLAGYKNTLNFLPKGMPKGDLKGQPCFELRYKLKGIPSVDEEAVLTAAETLLVDFSELLR